MMYVKEVPVNKKEFDDLKIFCKEILDSFLPSGITPIAYGSLAYFGHVRDTKSLINDVDLLVNEKEFEKILKAVKESAIDYEYFDEQHKLHLKESEVSIEIDSIDFWFKGLELTYVDFSFGGLEVKCLGRNSLIKTFEIAAKRDPERADEFLEKARVLRELEHKAEN